MKVGILRNEDSNSGNKWAIACEKFGLLYEIIDITSDKWYDKVVGDLFDFYLLRPSGHLSHFKTLYDERVYIISEVLKRRVFPTYKECYIYENKKLLSYFLKAQGIPHPLTSVFYSKAEAFDFLNEVKWPIVAKTSIGASGSGVMILRTKEEAEKYLTKAFSARGVKRRFGPNRITGKPSKWFSKAIQDPDYLIKKLKEYFSIYSHGERDFVLLQEFINHNFEWRAVKIGESYFAHQKIKTGDKASGSKGINYVNPPIRILNFIKELCDYNNFNFMAIDMFEYNDGFLVNELQTIFGHVQDHIMEVDGIQGRYVCRSDMWVFEPGDFNTNESYDLRLKTILQMLNEGR